MPNKPLYERFKKLIYRTRSNFIIFGIFITVVFLIALSFTTFTLKGAYFPELLASIITSNIIYHELKKSGKIDKYIHD